MADNPRVVEAFRGVTDTGKTARAICPFCVSAGHITRNRNLVLVRSTGFYKCFRCSRRGKLGSDVDLADGQETIQSSLNQAKLVDPPPGWVEIADAPMLCSGALSYALKRGLTMQQIHHAHMGIATEKGPDKQDFRGKLIIPIQNMLGEWQGYVGRDYTGRSWQKYMYPSGMDRGSIIYNERVIYKNRDSPVYIVEGCLDAICLYPHMDGAAVLGGESDRQVEILSKSRRPLVVMYDGDAWRKGEALAMRFALMGLKAGWIKLPPGKDPDEVTRDWILANTTWI